jgi:hypothetical protein
MKAAVEVDMFGCPNRCKHCWIGHSRNAHMSEDEFVWVAEQFKNYLRNSHPFFEGLIFSSWYREPEFSDNYQELWNICKQQSTLPLNRSEYELASIWRLVRDHDYSRWLKSIGVNCVQISLFGLEKNTDYYTGRQGNFRDCLTAIGILLDAGIAPRIQMFPLKTNIRDLENLEGILRDLDLEKRVAELGGEFTCFLNADFDPMGEGFNLEEYRINRTDAFSLPSYFIEKTLKHFKMETIDKLWPTEKELLPSLLENAQPLKDTPRIISFHIKSDFNAYPNCGEDSEWWCLGNLKTDGIHMVIDTFINHGNLGLRLNYETPIRYLARKYGNRDGIALYSRDALVHRWIRLEALRIFCGFV